MSENYQYSQELYWQHFMEHPKLWGYGMTKLRLEKIKTSCFNNRSFWADILYRHGGERHTPEEMMESDPQTYTHCFGNFMGMLMAEMYRAGTIK